MLTPSTSATNGPKATKVPRRQPPRTVGSRTARTVAKTNANAPLVSSTMPGSAVVGAAAPPGWTMANQPAVTTAPLAATSATGAATGGHQLATVKSRPPPAATAARV